MKKTHPRRAAGVTMIELLIVVTIVAILASLAMASYRQYILRGNRTYATRALQDLASREESYYFSNNSYTNSLPSLGASSSAGPNPSTVYYTVGVASASSSNYQVEATAVGSQTQDSACAALQLTRAGSQTSTGSGSTSQCWQSTQ